MLFHYRLVLLKWIPFHQSALPRAGLPARPSSLPPESGTLGHQLPLALGPEDSYLDNPLACVRSEPIDGGHATDGGVGRHYRRWRCVGLEVLKSSAGW
jgi:hypothetical protein